MVLGIESFSTTRAGYRAMLACFRSHGELPRVGVESTGSYGAGTTRHLGLSRVPVLGFSSNHHAPADVSGSAPGEGRLRFQPQSSGPSPQPCATCTVELLPSGAHGPQAGPLAPPHGCRSSNPPSRTPHLVLPRPLEWILVGRGRASRARSAAPNPNDARSAASLSAIVQCQVPGREGAASLRPPVHRAAPSLVGREGPGWFVNVMTTWQLCSPQRASADWVAAWAVS